MAWLRVFTRAAIGLVARSPHVRKTTGKKISVRLDRRWRYELDGGARPLTKRIKVHVEPGALRVCAPVAGQGPGQNLPMSARP